MILKVYYSGGRIDVFDTDRLVEGPPQPGNLLTNYTLDLSDVEGDCLWLRSYYHEAADSYKEEPGPTGLPVARRRDGWSFLIADADDLERLNRLTVDGETVLIRVAEDLVDASALSWAWEYSEDIVPKALSAYRFFSECACNKSKSDVFEAIGIPAVCFDSILVKSQINSDGESRF